MLNSNIFQTNNFFHTQNFFEQNYLLMFFSDQNFVWSHNFFQNKFPDPKFIVALHFFLFKDSFLNPKLFLNQIFFGLNIFSDPKFSSDQSFLSDPNFFLKILFRIKPFQAEDNLDSFEQPIENRMFAIKKTELNICIFGQVLAIFSLKKKRENFALCKKMTNKLGPSLV